MSPKPSENTSPPFVLSAAYYDLIFNGKDYLRESADVSNLLNGGNTGMRRLIEWGAGTGLYMPYWFAHGWNAIGIELCPEMAAIARGKGLPVRDGDICSDARDAHPTAGAAVCLFGSFSYACTDDDKLRAALKNVRFHLSAGSRFVFDVVNLACAAAKLKFHSADSYKIDGGRFLRRRMKKYLDVPLSLVNCEIKFEITEPQQPWNPALGPPSLRSLAVDDSWTEHHIMRAFSPPELRHALTDADFNVVSICDPESGDDVRLDSYYFQVVAEAC